MTDKPNCGNCPHYKYLIVETEGGYCSIADDFIDHITDTIEKVGCLSHPGAREWLMRDVIEKLQATIKCNSRWNKLELYYVGVNAATEEAIDLIRGRGKK